MEFFSKRCWFCSGFCKIWKEGIVEYEKYWTIKSGSWLAHELGNADHGRADSETRKLLGISRLRRIFQLRSIWASKLGLKLYRSKRAENAVKSSIMAIWSPKHILRPTSTVISNVMSLLFWWLNVKLQTCLCQKAWSSPVWRFDLRRL